MMCSLHDLPIPVYPTTCLFELACVRALSEDACEYLLKERVVKSRPQNYAGVGRYAGTSIYDTRIYCSFCREWRPKTAEIHYDSQANIRCNKCGQLMRLSARRESKTETHPMNKISGSCPNCGKPVFPFWKICGHCMCDLNGSNKRTV